MSIYFLYLRFDTLIAVRNFYIPPKLNEIDKNDFKILCILEQLHR